eukprot:9135293-Pyramimonas_sp.AAC.1
MDLEDSALRAEDRDRPLSAPNWPPGFTPPWLADTGRSGVRVGKAQAHGGAVRAQNGSREDE